MVRKIPPTQRQITLRKAGLGRIRHLVPVALLLVFAVPVVPVTAYAESAAAQNRKGNELFAEKKYEEAEKAYLEAQGQSPGKPEILYNLGNSLVKQGKYQQGIQSLRQSAAGDNKPLKADSLYNSGDALYSMGDFKGAADAFVEALKLDPEDPDAKHNLELALRQIQQQKQNRGKGKEQNKQDQNKDRGKQDNQGKTHSPKPKEKPDQSKGQNREDEKTQPSQPVPREGSMTREQALKILDAMQNQEEDQQRRKIESLSRSRTKARDW
jgi:Ca-activated chloride channel family protein